MIHSEQRIGLSGRWWLAAAGGAPDAEQVRGIWRAARAAGEPRWYLDLIAGIGRRKAGAALSRAGS